MLISAVLNVLPESLAFIPPGQGAALESLFLSWLSGQDPAYAAELHAMQDKPFTVSDLQPARPHQKDAPPGSLWWRITSLTSRLSTLLVEKVLPALPPAFTLENCGGVLRIVSCSLDPHDHPWAGRSSYEEMIQQTLLSPQKPGSILDLQFLTPTGFHQEGKQMLFPMPGNVFESWLRRWNAFAPAGLPAEVRALAEQWVAVSRYRLASGCLRSEGGLELGFTGFCRYRILTPDPYWLRVLHTLAAYSFYCATGRKTARGMGLTRAVRRGSP